MYPNQQQQPLQADPTRQTVQPINIQQGNPPFVPNVNCPGELQNYVGYIVTALMLEVQEKAVLNSARMYAYNFMAPNNFATNEFVNLTQVAVDYIDAVMRTSPGATIEQCLNDLIPDLVGKYCLALTSFFPDLYSFLDQNTANHVNPAIQGMQQIANMIAQVKSQLGRGGVQQQFQNGRMTGQWPTQAGNMSGGYQSRPPAQAAALGGVGGAAADRLFAATAPAPAQQRVMMSPGSDGQMSRYARQAMQRATEEQQARDTYQSTYRPLVTTAQEVQSAAKPGGFQPITRVRPPGGGFQLPSPTTTAEPQGESQPVPLNIKPVTVQPIAVQEEELVWRASDTQPYRLIYDFTKFKSQLVRVGDDVIEVLKELTTEETQNMNIDDHALTRPPLPRYDATATETPAEPITDRTIEVPTFALEFHDTSLLELSTGIVSAITGLRYAISRTNKDRAGAKCFPAIMVEAISVEDAETADRHNLIIEQLSACDTFEKAVGILDTIHDSAADRLFFNRINRLLTQELNNVLVMNFGSFWMDDFYADVMSVLPAIAKKRGVAISQSFLSKQRLFFQQFIAAMSAETLAVNTSFLKEEYIDNKIENPEQWQGKFVVLPWETSFTHLNMPSYQLNISLKPGETGVLNEKTTPELWSLADQIMNHANCSDARRHYLVTEDGVQLLLARGYIREDAYLIRRVREVA